MARRRNKQDMELMQMEVNYWLLLNKNNPHKAYDEFIKDHLRRGKSFPYYVTGLKDFVQVSNDKKNNDYLQYEDRKETKKTAEEQKEELLNTITEDYYKQFILPVYKNLDDSNKNTKMAIISLWYAVTTKDINMISNSELGYIKDFLSNIA